jgi:DNA mismatch repair ATPase MutS
MLAPASKELKKTNAISNELSNIEERLNVIRDQMNSLPMLSNATIVELQWIEEMLGDKPLDIRNEMDELLKILHRFNTRNNMLLGMVFNCFLGWDIFQRIALENWTNKNKSKLTRLENGLATLEALTSVAFVRFNYPETIYALETNNHSMAMKGLVHPLLAHAKSIENDFQLDPSKQFMILTGPNMAGKSTYLRAVACAVIFANAGFPVFASEYSCPNVQLYTSMRTSDDLSENSSYFFAELSRLRMIMDAVESDKYVFVLLDEILKGTNSKDKEEGSYLFMEKMQKLGAKGIIATHDLSLCQLESKNEAFFTGHFDSIIYGRDLSFDYKLKNGICQNMNASFLLKKMKLTD